MPRKLCDGCFPQINKLKSVMGRARFYEKRPSYQYDYYRDTHEVLVAMTCRVCGNLIIYKGRGKVPQKCGLCRCIERSRPRPLWNPKDIETFISVERHRLGLDKKKKWLKSDILALDEERNWGSAPVAVAYDE